MPKGMKLGNQEGWNIFLKDIALTYNPDSRTVS